MIEIEIENPAWTAALPDADAIARRAAQAAQTAHDLGDVTVLLTDDATVHDLNRRFRDQDKPTNVLSFPAAAHAGGHLGDLALAYGVCAREATTQKKSLGDHLSHLVVHGVLHLLGYDHLNDADADRMEATERTILAGLGIADPYAGDDRVDAAG